MAAAGPTGARQTSVRLMFLMGGPIAIAAAGWIYLGVMIGDMSAIPGMSSMMMSPRIFDPMQLSGLFLMWSVMMAAMMLPTAIPMILAYTRMQAAGPDSGPDWLPVFLFSAAYVLAWAGFSLAAAGLQAGLTDLALMSPMMMKAVASPLAGSILVIAGLYQFTPLKRSCLRQCRTPMSFLMTQWRDGLLGAASMGWRHGLYCMGCCWALMGLLFVSGVMNPVWIVAIALYVLLEKSVPHGELVSKLVGAGLTGLGLSWIVI